MENMITCEKISVKYRVPKERISGIKEYAVKLLTRKLFYNEFWALDNVSFTVKKGEVLGVVGRNGAGKSTLLKVISRVLIPIQGRIVTIGNIAPLLELGAGFNMELTGRENIFLNGAILGYSRKETTILFDSIIDFAEIHDFVDAPMRTYSSGMIARLGFAVATCKQPSILLVDEVLSVGDAKFQEKCIERMYRFRNNGTTILFVSHSIGVVESFCDNAIWLESGQLKNSGNAKWITEEYLKNK